MNRRALTYASGTVFGAALLMIVAARVWNTWPLAVRYRMRRNEAAIHKLTARYLGGALSLDSAAEALAQRLDAQAELEWRLDDLGENNSASITALSIMLTPLGDSATDPRITELGERTMEAVMGPAAYTEAKARMQRLRDSLDRLSPSGPHPVRPRAR